MYTRSFPQNGTLPPEDYRGTALGDVHNDCEETKDEAVSAQPKGGVLGGLFDKLPFLSGGVRLPFFEGGSFKLGVEELLIIATAALLFFSEGGDKECAIILILLLFVG